VTTRRTPRRTTRRASTKRAATKRSTTRRTSPTGATSGTRRRQSTPATTLGAAVGTVVVAFVLGAPWSVRIALIVIVLVGVAGYLVWSRRQ
jgi:Flp pilus assembly protein TadB